MFTIFRYAVSRSRGQVLAWGIALAVYGAYLMSFYDTLMEQREQIEQLLEAYPPELFAFFGGVTDFFSPSGYLHTYLFSYMPLVIGIYALLAGSGLLAGDEENGVLDLILAHPVSRTRIFMGRFAAFTVSTAAILALIWLGFALVVPATAFTAGPGTLALPFVSLFALLMVIGTFSLLMSMVLPSRRMAAMTSGILLGGGYFISSMATIDENLEQVARISPIEYYQGGYAIEGLNWEWFGGLLAVSLGFFLLAWLLFERRDIRVGGEGGWKLPALRLRRRSDAFSE